MSCKPTVTVILISNSLVGSGMITATNRQSFKKLTCQLDAMHLQKMRNAFIRKSIPIDNYLCKGNSHFKM